MHFVMTDGPIQIRKADVVRDIRTLADITHQPITEAVGRAVRAELDRARRASSDDQEKKRRAVAAVLDRIRRLPIVGPVLTDDDLYDEDGLPK
jgi:hypothetical protein